MSYQGLEYDYLAQAQRVETVSGAMASKAVTYTNGANANGDFDGSGNPQTLFNVTGGQVQIAIIAVCSTTVTGATATLAVGNATTATRYIPQQTATNITVGKTVDITGIVSAGTAPNVTPSQVAMSGEAIIATVGTADITAGVITYYAFWKALTSGATVTAA